MCLLCDFGVQGRKCGAGVGAQQETDSQRGADDGRGRKGGKLGSDGGRGEEEGEGRGSEVRERKQRE